MTFVNNQAYERDHDFSLVELAPLTPADIKGGCVEAYGTPEPGPETHSQQQPQVLEEGDLFLHAEQAYGMECYQWTKDKVSKLVKAVQKKEVRKQGAPSMTRRSMMIDEFKATILLMNNDDIVRRYGIPNFLRYQFHMIARIDDTTQFLMENLTAHPDFDFTLQSKLTWSKNVHEERDAQIRF
jgi:hypothetical protein